MAGKSARAEETTTPPWLTKSPSVTKSADGRGSLGQVDGAQGALVRPGWIRGCEQTQSRRRATSATTTVVLT